METEFGLAWFSAHGCEILPNKVDRVSHGQATSYTDIDVHIGSYVSINIYIHIYYLHLI